MICLAYFSSARGQLDASTLGGILDVSRRNNTRCGVTGLLCHHDGSFLQFLEGEPDDVQATYERISADPRHHTLIEVQRRTIQSRAFGQWSMGLVRMSDIGEAERAFCTGLRDVEIARGAEHREMIEPILNSFRAWLR